MLKNSFLSTKYNEFTSKTCGEITYQNETSFSIVCKFCDIKIFEFKEFVQHFRCSHWPDINKSKILNKIEENNETFLEHKANKIIKTDVFENFIISEQNELSNDEEYWIEEENHKELSDTSYISDNEKKESILEKEREKEQSLSSHSLFVHNIDKCSGKEFKCDKCTEVFTQKSQLTTHHNLNHGYSCKICNMVFLTRGSLRYHKEVTHTETKIFICDYENCKKVFQRKVSLRYHKNTSHIETKNFICDYDNCDKAFVNKSRLQVHKKRFHLLEPNFQCEICGARCRDNVALIVHLRTHTGEKPFICSICDRRFSSKSMLCEHQACHETERKHVCDVCGKSFNRAKSLYNHKHLHLKEKKYVCKICDAVYAQAPGLSAHMRKHKEQINDIKKSENLYSNEK